MFTAAPEDRVGDMDAFGPSTHALSVMVGHSRPGREGKRDGQQASGYRRQPDFGPRVGARADVTAPGPGYRRDGWPGCCGQHKSNTSPGPGCIQPQALSRQGCPCIRTVDIRICRPRSVRRAAAARTKSSRGRQYLPRKVCWPGRSDTGRRRGTHAIGDAARAELPTREPRAVLVGHPAGGQRRFVTVLMS